MGLFFEEKRADPPPVVQEIKQGWLAVLIAGILSIATLILVGVAKAYWHMLKPLLTIEGKTRQQLSMHLPVAAVLMVGPLYVLYVTVPAVRDFASLSATHTINHTNGYRIFFPDRSYFIIDSVRRGGQFNSKTYITYSGYTEGTFQKMRKGECQMVPRGTKIRLGSEDPPTNAEGFKEKVGYVVRRDMDDLSGTDYLLEWAKLPNLWLDRKKLERTTVDIHMESSWGKFIDDWDEIKEDADGYRSFEVRALAREHAVACF